MMDNNDMPCRMVDVEKCKRCISFFENYNVIRHITKKTNIRLPSIKNTYLDNRLKFVKNFFYHAKKVLPVSAGVERIFKEAIPDANYKILNIGNATASFFTKKEKNSNGYINAVFLGTLNRHKGGDLFLDIANRVKNNLVKFSFYGRASAEYELAMSKSNVINHGSYSPSDIKNILSDVDVGLVLPIWEDNGPQVVMELLNNGVPVIGTNVGGIPDFVDHLTTGYLFNPDSKQEIDQFIAWMNSLNETDIDKLMKNIKRLKTLNEHAEELLILYRSV